MRIISVGSEPPPPITSAVAEWPSAANVGVYVTDDRQIFVADRPDGSVFLKGSYELGDKR